MHTGDDRLRDIKHEQGETCKPVIQMKNVKCAEYARWELNALWMWLFLLFLLDKSVAPFRPNRSYTCDMKSLSLDTMQSGTNGIQLFLATDLGSTNVVWAWECQYLILVNLPLNRMQSCHVKGWFACNVLSYSLPKDMPGYPFPIRITTLIPPCSIQPNDRSNTVSKMENGTNKIIMHKKKIKKHTFWICSCAGVCIARTRVVLFELAQAVCKLPQKYGICKCAYNRWSNHKARVNASVKREMCEPGDA